MNKKYNKNTIECSIQKPSQDIKNKKSTLLILDKRKDGSHAKGNALRKTTNTETLGLSYLIILSDHTILLCNR